jgi:hypothetical protein
MSLNRCKPGAGGLIHPESVAIPRTRPLDPFHPEFEDFALPDRAEHTTVGIDEQAQLIGADPYGLQAGLGLRVPALALANAAPQTSRYLFLLALLEIPKNQVLRLRGIRQLVKLGAQVGSEGSYRAVEQQIEDPSWHPKGANISWHVRSLGPPGQTGILGLSPTTPPPPATMGVANFAYLMAGSPALLYQSATLVGGYYVNLSAYVPPNGGQPYGKPVPGLGGYATRYDLFEPWRASQAWHSFDLPVYGPDTIAVFASVRQANTSVTNYALAAPTIPGGQPIEEQFLTNYPTASYWRIGASLVVDS